MKPILPLLIVLGACSAPGATDPEAANRPIGAAEPVEMEAIQLQHASAVEVAERLQGELGPGARIVADPRTNSIVFEGSAGALARVRERIAQLDRPLGGAR